MAIYIKNAEKSYNRTSLIKMFIKERPESYSNPECTQVQCRAGAFRSVTELLEMTQVYYPRTTLAGVLAIIKNLINKGENIALIWCTQVKKVVLKYVSNQERLFVTNISRSRYHKTKGVDGYSISDYEAIINNQ